MVEPIMFFGLGFLAASLIGLIIVPFVHGRAVRLTVRRLEAATPLSMAEIQADKDQLRAEFAMSTRRLEMSVDQLKGKSTGQLAELGKKNDTINRLKIELGEKAATIFALEARDKGIKDQLRATEDELEVKTNALRETERNLADKEAEFARATAQLSETTANSDGQRVEIVALKTQIDNLKDQASDLGRQVKDIEERYAREKEAHEKAAKELAEERGNVQNLGTRIGQLERQLATQTSEAEIMGRRIADMETRLTEQARVLDRPRARARPVARGCGLGAPHRGRSASGARHHRAPQRERNRSVARRKDNGRKPARTRARGSRQAAARAFRDEARGGSHLGIGAGRECAAARAHQRCRGGSGAPDRRSSKAPARRSTRSSPREHAPGTNGSGKPAIQPAANTNGEEGKGSLADRIRALQARSSRLSSAT